MIYNVDIEHGTSSLYMKQVTKIVSGFWLPVVGKVYGVAEVGAWMIGMV